MKFIDQKFIIFFGCQKKIILTTYKYMEESLNNNNKKLKNGYFEVNSNKLFFSLFSYYYRCAEKFYDNSRN